MLRTEVCFEIRSGEGSLQQASLSFDYHPIPSLGMWVPVEMNECYEHLAFRLDVNPTVVANARCSNYRRFRVTVDTEARLPPESPQA